MNKKATKKEADKIVKMIKDAGVTYATRYLYVSEKKNTYKVKLWHCSIKVIDLLEKAGVISYLNKKEIKHAKSNHHFFPTSFAFWLSL